jgi:hypothetical protein
VCLKQVKKVVCLLVLTGVCVCVCVVGWFVLSVQVGVSVVEWFVLSVCDGVSVVEWFVISVYVGLSVGADCCSSFISAVFSVHFMPHAA